MNMETEILQQQKVVEMESVNQNGVLMDRLTGLPAKQGLYDPSFETAACGVGFVVSIDGIPSHKVRHLIIYITLCRLDE